MYAQHFVFPGMTILAKSGITFFEHEKKCVRISTVFRHCVRAFLLCSSTFRVHFYYFLEFYCVPALPHAEMLMLKCILGCILDCFRLLLGCSTFWEAE